MLVRTTHTALAVSMSSEASQRAGSGRASGEHARALCRARTCRAARPPAKPPRCAARLKKGAGKTCRGTPTDCSVFCADHAGQQAVLDAESYVLVPPARLI